jgi:hypothetical protein
VPSHSAADTIPCAVLDIPDPSVVWTMSMSLANRTPRCPLATFPLLKNPCPRGFRLQGDGRLPLASGCGRLPAHEELEGRFSRAITMLTNSRDELSVLLSKVRSGLTSLQITASRGTAGELPEGREAEKDHD